MNVVYWVYSFIVFGVLIEYIVGGCVCMLGVGMIKVLEVYDRMWI